ncbi:MAG: regulatory protein RecX [Clostridia bacterium]|nr:regulatory protein RecX [Clostridia bacterium]
MILTWKDGKQDKLHLFLNGDYTMTVDRAFAASAGLHQNQELDEAELALLTQQVNSRRAFNKGCDLLTRRDHSRAELLTKLRQKGYAAGAEDALEQLDALGYLDDARFAESYAAELQRSRHYGKRRIEQALLQKGVDRSVARDAVEALTFADEDLDALIQKKYLRYLSDEKGVRRTVNALLRLGYSYEDIRNALRRVEEDTE